MLKTNHEPTSFLPWLIEQEKAVEGSPEEDFFLRGAAARGSIVAMTDLMLNVYNSEKDDWEAWRWARRVLFLLGRSDRIDTSVDQEMLESIEPMAKETAERVEKEMPKTKDGRVFLQLPRAPQDVGLPGQFNYCLNCGRWKLPDAPLDQCDDSVHLVRRVFGS